jgi:phosphatidylinositol glycan class T
MHSSNVSIDQHHSLFPLSLAQLLRRYGVKGLHLSLNAGKWNYEGWGYPDVASVSGGVELWAWLSAAGDER